LLRIVTLTAAGVAIALGFVAWQYQATVNPMLVAIAAFAMPDRSMIGRKSRCVRWVAGLSSRPLAAGSR